MITTALCLASFILGIAVSKNLMRWLMVTFWTDPVGAVGREIEHLKALQIKLMSWL